MNIMKEAHKLTKEIKNKFPEVNYNAQLGICISYLYEIKGEVIMEDNRITELKELAKESKNYNKVWNKVESFSKEIRNRKFNNEEIESFKYKAENIVELAIEILKEEIKEVKKEVIVKTKSEKNNRIYAQYETFDAETQERINIGDEIKYIKGLGWIKAENY